MHIPTPVACKPLLVLLSACASVQKPLQLLIWAYGQYCQLQADSATGLTHIFLTSIFAHMTQIVLKVHQVHQPGMQPQILISITPVSGTHPEVGVDSYYRTINESEQENARSARATLTPEQ